jgi:hypothetical protein
MFVEFPARSEDQIKPVSINPLHVIAISAAGQDSCEVLTTVRSFWVQLPYREVIRRLAAAASAAEAGSRTAAG